MLSVDYKLRHHDTVSAAPTPIDLNVTYNLEALIVREPPKFEVRGKFEARGVRVWVTWGSVESQTSTNLAAPFVFTAHLYVGY